LCVCNQTDTTAACLIMGLLRVELAQHSGRVLLTATDCVACSCS
jgi:hypothetical protein